MTILETIQQFASTLEFASVKPAFNRDGTPAGHAFCTKGQGTVFIPMNIETDLDARHETVEQYISCLNAEYLNHLRHINFNSEVVENEN